MTTLREAAQQALEALEFSTLDAFMLAPISPGRESTIKAITALRAALAEPVLAPAPGYCKHCKQYTIEEPLPAEPVQEPVADKMEEAHDWQYRMAGERLRRIEKLEAQRDVLLEALRTVVKEFKKYGRQHWPEAVKAQAAIDKVEAQ